jgi:hypothetical protein
LIPFYSQTQISKWRLNLKKLLHVFEINFGNSKDFISWKIFKLLHVFEINFGKKDFISWKIFKLLHVFEINFGKKVSGSKAWGCYSVSGQWRVATTWHGHWHAAVAFHGLLTRPSRPA